jgi:tRNA(Arg) A34 adenosine deaminase TadA
MSYYGYSSKKPCVICGTEFIYARSDRVFCSNPNCRKVASRQKQAVEKEYERISQALNNLEAYIKSDHRLKKEALALIEKTARLSNIMLNEHGGQRHIFQAGDKSVTQLSGTD